MTKICGIYHNNKKSEAFYQVKNASILNFYDFFVYRTPFKDENSETHGALINFKGIKRYNIAVVLLICVLTIFAICK